MSGRAMPPGGAPCPSRGRAGYSTGTPRRLVLGTLLLLACGAGQSASATEPAYQAQFLVEIQPEEQSAAATIKVIQSRQRLKRLRLTMPAAGFSAVSGDGEVTREGDVVLWEVPARGGDLRYRVPISHQRSDKGYDALLTEQWALFRAEDVFPGAVAVHQRGARGSGELLLRLPPGWSSVTPYLPDPAGRLLFEHPGRSFARPLGWILAGEIGSRMDIVGDTTVRVAAPRGQGAQRVPMLALIRSTLPVLQAELPQVIPYLLVVTAGDPMWRGGLSAPNSLFVHASRPLISENGTSTLVHELLHVLAPIPAASEHDWIDEGFPEYLGLVTLLRGQVISRERFDHAIRTFRRRGATVTNMLTRTASGAVTARSVAVLHDLDEELRRRSQDRVDIFDLLRRMIREQEPIDTKRLRVLAAGLLNAPSVEALSPARLPGTR
jgi:hypothetical protein